MTLSIIVAMGRDRAIGAAGDMAFHIKPDLRRFRDITMGHPVVMGRRTFESLPKGALPGRRNIVVSRNPAFSAPATETAPSLSDALALVADAEQVFIIGGASVYAQALPLATKMYLTVVDADFPEADTFFPVFDENQWTPTDESQPATDPATGLSYRFIDLQRI